MNTHESTTTALAEEISLHEPVPPGYSERLYNHDLAPVKKRTWGTYNLFAMWMSDVHSVGGYVFAAGLFFLGLTGWQVLASLLIGIAIVNYFVNKVGRISVRYGVPFPVAARISFGVYGANIAALIRAVIAIAWYGIQTWLASVSIVLLILRFFPELAWAASAKFLGLSYLGWACFLTLWLVQTIVFYHGMETIRRFIDWAGPGVYVVMFALAIWIVAQAGLDSISLSLKDVELSTGETIYLMCTAAALVVAYFSTLLLNFGDFSRFATSERAMRKGNFLGLPINFLLFSLVTVVTTAGTVAVFGHALLDPVEIVGRIPNTSAMLLGSLTLIIATVGINIVANFVSAAYDLSNVAPKYIDFRRGGLIASFAAVLILPWHLYSSPVVINFFLEGLAAFLGPLFGIMVTDYYLVKRQDVKVDDLFRDHPQSRYWYQRGFNKLAIQALVPAAAIAMCFVLIPFLHDLAPFSWFIGAGLGASFYYGLNKRAGTVVQEKTGIAPMA